MSIDASEANDSRAANLAMMLASLRRALVGCDAAVESHWCRRDEPFVSSFTLSALQGKQGASVCSTQHT